MAPGSQLAPESDALSLPPRAVAALSEIRARLRSRFGDRLRRFTLFGSWAWGWPHGESDFDVCVVVDGLTHREHVEIVELAADRAIELDVDVSVIAWSSERFQRGLDHEQRLVKDIVEKGVPL